MTGLSVATMSRCVAPAPDVPPSLNCTGAITPGSLANGDSSSVIGQPAVAEYFSYCRPRFRLADPAASPRPRGYGAIGARAAYGSEDRDAALTTQRLVRPRERFGPNPPVCRAARTPRPELPTPRWLDWITRRRGDSESCPAPFRVIDRHRAACSRPMAPSSW
jgi:hypothetical protein